MDSSVTPGAEIHSRTCLAHLSDLHFGRETPRVVDALLRKLENCNPDLVIISGDLTQRATKREFVATRNFLDQLCWPCLVVPGNHDLAAYDLLERFGNPWEKWHRHLNLDTQHCVVRDLFAAAGINTARRVATPFDWTMGRINQPQLQWIGEQLRPQPPHKLRVLVAHHPFWLPMKQEHRKLIKGRDAALSSLAKIHVDLILSGHVHIAYTQVCSGIIISHAGTTISNRISPGHPNSFNLIRGDRNQLSIALMEWNGSDFQELSKPIYLRNNQAWQEAPQKERSTINSDQPPG